MNPTRPAVLACVVSGGLGCSDCRVQSSSEAAPRRPSVRVSPSRPADMEPQLCTAAPLCRPCSPGLPCSVTRETTLPTTLCASGSLRLPVANRERPPWRGPKRDILKGPGIAGVSGHGGYSDYSIGGGGQCR